MIRDEYLAVGLDDDAWSRNTIAAPANRMSTEEDSFFKKIVPCLVHEHIDDFNPFALAQTVGTYDIRQ